MSELETRRAGVCARVVGEGLSVGKAAGLMELSYRQAKRVLRRYRSDGALGLVHGNLGRRSNRTVPLRDLRVQALALVRDEFRGFGPTLAAEHLASEYELKVCAETLRLWMLEEGLWSRTRRRRPHRQRRERMAHFGEMVQVDGSFHHWLGEDRPSRCMITFIDDATGVVLAGFSAGETTWGVTAVLEKWVRRYGVPRAIYADRGSVFQKRKSRRRRNADPDLTQFARMLDELGIRLLKARSPQAKGRVERSHGTHQDRLIKKMARRGITDYEGANEFLAEYLSGHNGRFARAPREPDDLHLTLDPAVDLRNVLSLRYTRLVSRDLVVSYRRRALQLTRRSRVSPGRRIVVREARDGSVKLFLSGIELEYTELPRQESGATNGFRPRPLASHPWRYPGSWAHRERYELSPATLGEGTPQSSPTAQEINP